MFRFGLGATLMLAIVSSSLSAHGANCLAYLAADVAYERAIAPYSQTKKRLRETAEATYRRAVREARAREAKAKRDAERVRKRAFAAAQRRFLDARKAAYSVYDKSLPSNICRSVTANPKGAKFCNPIGKGRRIEEAAKRKFNQALRPAWTAKHNTEKAARRVHFRMVKAAKRQRERDENAATATLRHATALENPSMKKARRIFQQAKLALNDAYIAAYASPGPYRRKVEIYDRDIVLTVARHERKYRCPKLPK